MGRERIHELEHLSRYYTVAIPVPRMDDNIPGRNLLLPQQLLRPAKLKGLVPQCENRRILAFAIFRQDRIHSWPYAIDAVLDAHGQVNAHPLHRAPLVQAPCTGRPLCRRAASKLEAPQTKLSRYHDSREQR